MRLGHALARYAADRAQGTVGRDALLATETACRASVARLLACASDEVALLSSTTDALNAVLHSLPWSPGDNLVVTDLEFPTALIACLHLGRRLGVEVRVVRHRGGRIDPELLAERIDTRTRLVVVSHVSYRSGYRCDVASLARLAHERGALIFVDAAQSLGAVQVHVGDVDFLASCTFKWLLGSHGLAVLYCRRELVRELTPTHVGWRSVSDHFSVARTLRYELLGDARRFEAGMPNFEAVYALHDALVLLLDEVGMDWVEERVLDLSGRAVAGLGAIGVPLLTPDMAAERAGIVTFEAVDSLAIGAALEARGIVTWCRDGRVRVSPHFYNTAGEVDAFCGAVGEVWCGTRAKRDDLRTVGVSDG